METDLNDSIERVYGDSDQLKQVILNIVINSFQAIHHDGTTRIKSWQDSSSIFVEIEDNGSGMSTETQERLFELYYTTKHDGGGIGMSICKNIVEAHEGKISFESTMDRGTVFYIEIPRIDRTAQLKAVAAMKSV